MEIGIIPMPMSTDDDLDKVQDERVFRRRSWASLEIV